MVVLPLLPCRASPRAPTSWLLQFDAIKANNDGRAPLQWASLGGYVDVVMTLLAAKAEVDKADSGRYYEVAILFLER